MTAIEIHYADDDEDDLEIFEEAVKQLAADDDFQISLNVYKDGDSLLKSLRKRRNPNILVFLDINMPEKNGHEILKEIRQDEMINSLPVIMFSTSSNPQTIKSCYNSGANLYTVKPGNFNELVKNIREIIRIDWKTFSREHHITRLPRA